MSYPGKDLGVTPVPRTSLTLNLVLNPKLVSDVRDCFVTTKFSETGDHRSGRVYDNSPRGPCGRINPRFSLFGETFFCFPCYSTPEDFISERETNSGLCPLFLTHGRVKVRDRFRRRLIVKVSTEE